MKKIKLLFAGAVIAFAALQGCKKDKNDDVAVNPLTKASYVTFNGAMRKLWADHMQWTYATVDAYYHDPNGVNAQLTRLLQNQKDIGNAIKPYYGNAAGDTLTSLLNTHINLAVPVLDAAKNNDQPALDQALADWYANAKDIADFLSAANPTNWHQHDMEHMMEMHIDQTTAYAVDLLNNDYTNAIIHYDAAFNHMMEMADALSEGIALQFPGKF